MFVQHFEILRWQLLLSIILLFYPDVQILFQSARKLYRCQFFRLGNSANWQLLLEKKTPLHPALQY